MLTAGLALLVAVCLFAWLGPLVINVELAQIGTAVPRQRPGAEHLLGSDVQGRDILAALVLATPQTLKIGFFAGVIGLGLGTVMGLLAGYFRGWTDTVIRTLADVVMTIPGIAVLRSIF